MQKNEDDWKKIAFASLVRLNQFTPNYWLCSVVLQHFVKYPVIDMIFSVQRKP